MRSYSSSSVRLPGIGNDNYGNQDLLFFCRIINGFFFGRSEFMNKSQPNLAVVIPVRYGSTRLPGKPLKEIAGRTMLSRVVALAKKGVEPISNCRVVVATESDPIGAHCDELGVEWIKTPDSCRNGTDCANSAAEIMGNQHDFILSLQGDTPLTPHWFVTKMLEAFLANPDSVEVVTPVVKLTWEELDQLRESKLTTPFTGTTVIRDRNNRALWFSKNIIPGLRYEQKLRSPASESHPYSPVLRHIGMYGYRRDVLAKYVTLDPGFYEELEGLEQLRLLENGISITAAEVSYEGRPSTSGVDTLQDIVRAEAYIEKYGDPYLECQ